MSTQARASLERGSRPAGTTLQLAPGNDIVARNALTIASLLQRSGARPIIAGSNRKLASEWRMAGGEWLALENAPTHPIYLAPKRSLQKKSLVHASTSFTPISRAGAGSRSRPATDDGLSRPPLTRPKPSPRRLRPLFHQSLARGDHISSILRSPRRR